MSELDLSRLKSLILFLEAGNLDETVSSVVNWGEKKQPIFLRYHKEYIDWHFAKRSGPQGAHWLEGIYWAFSPEYKILSQWAKSHGLTLTHEYRYRQSWGAPIRCYEALVIRPNWRLRLQRILSSWQRALS